MQIREVELSAGRVSVGNISIFYVMIDEHVCLCIYKSVVNVPAVVEVT